MDTNKTQGRGDGLGVVATGLWAVIPTGILTTLLVMGGVRGVLPSLVVFGTSYWCVRKIRARRTKEGGTTWKEVGLAILFILGVFMVVPMLLLGLFARP